MAPIDPPLSERDLDLRFLDIAFGTDADYLLDLEEPIPDLLTRLRKGAATVTLRGLPDPKDPTGQPRPDDAQDLDETPARFEVIGEIARGGMGVIYKAKDGAIGRNVALKTLPKSEGQNANLRYRFIEEAQVCGQLHHPGVAPIHDIGLLDDGRPFFVMKLVSGRTLAAILKSRGDAGEDRSHCLAIFDRVCEAVAYAHSRGVIHRDLKPTNILVGGFGETQVMDWGLAKVMKPGDVVNEPQTSDLADELQAADHDVETVRSENSAHDSMSGSVLGTAPYMAPEQARGEVSALDRRTDVFSLGAILLEILTGAPPYEASDREEALTLAAQAQLEPAHRRLDESGADPDLLSLTRDCLSPEMMARPADAQIVARRFSKYLRAVETRAHRAELEAVKARTEARSERRLRQRTILLATALLLIALVGGVGWWVIESHRRERVVALTRSVATATDRARRLQAEALSAPLEDLAKWTYALSSAQDAEAMTMSPEAPAELSTSAAALVKEVTAQRDEHARTLRVVTGLDEIRSRHEERHESRSTDEAYAAVFMEFGIDPTTMTAPEISETVCSSRVPDALVSGLDDWAFTRRKVGGEDSSWRRLSDAAAQSDSDSLRGQLRAAWVAGDVDGLRKLATPDVLENTTVETATLLAQSLFDAGDKELALTVLRSAQLRHPHEYLVNHDLGQWQHLLGDVPASEIINSLSMALAARPFSAHARVDLANALSENGDVAGAIAHYEAARAIFPSHHVLFRLVTLYRHLGETSLEWERLENLVQSHPQSAPGHLLRATYLWRRLGRFPEALESLQRAIDLDPQYAAAYCNRGLLLLDMGRNTEALSSLHEGHALAALRDEEWPYPSADWVARAELALSLEPALERIIAGEDFPADQNELHDLAVLAFARGEHILAVELHQARLDSSAPTESPCRVCAVRAASVVGIKEGSDLTALSHLDRARWRREALTWMEEELASIRAGVGTPALNHEAVRSRLLRCSESWELASVRPSSWHEDVSPTERQAWISIWTDLNEILDELK